MCFWGFRFWLLAVVLAVGTADLWAQSQDSSSSSSSPASHASQKAPRVVHADSAIDAGAVRNGVYRNKTLGLACKIPAGWVLRTEEMNAREEGSDSGAESKSPPQGTQRDTQDSGTGRVLLAAFSRPPDARAADVNSSIVIAAEPAAAYPGLKDAAQYFGPLTEVAKAQGFSVVEEPYEFALGAKTLPRSDFQKEVGTRVMRQSTLAMLARGWAVSITFIGGTEDEVEELVEGLSFAAGTGAKK